MIKFFRIALWEFKLRIRSKSFLFTTIFTPLLLASLVYIPTSQMESKHIFRIGIIDASQDSLFKRIEFKANSQNKYLEIKKIYPESKGLYQYLRNKEKQIKNKLDSTNRVYYSIKSKRTALFLKHQRTNNPQLKLELVNLYDIQSASHEVKDSIEYDLKKIRTDIQETFIAEAKDIANRALNYQEIDAYVYLEKQTINSGKVEYHSINPGHFIIKEQLQNIISNIIFQNRLLRSKLNSKQTQKVLKPIIFNTFQLKEGQSLNYENFTSYYGLIIAVMLMFISIFFSAGTVFSSLVTEKNNRILEFILSTATKAQVYFGKIVGLAFIGLIQLSIWLFILILLFQFDSFELHKIPYLTWSNMVYFYIYYILAYFMFATFLAGISVIYMSEQESHNLNQLIRIAAIFPLVFALMVLENPDSSTIRLLSFIPFLAPSFMVMRIPLSSTLPLGDIQITIFLLILTVIVIYLVSFRLFCIYSNLYGKRPSIIEMVGVLWRGKI